MYRRVDRPAIFGGLRICGEPVADGSGLRMFRFTLKNFQIMIPGKLWLEKLLGIQIGQGKMSTRFLGMFRQDSFQFLHCLLWKVRLLQGQTKIIAGVFGIRFKSERVS